MSQSSRSIALFPVSTQTVHMGVMQDCLASNILYTQGYCDMSTHRPEPTQFCAKLAKLHASTHPPTGKFFYHVPTFQGYFQQVVDWDDSRALFFLVRSDVKCQRIMGRL